MKRSLLLLIAISLASCCGIPQQARLVLPPDVNCPTLTDKELMQVSDETYKRIANLYISCIENDKTLRDIIRATHK
jgi:hypothetical protein